MTTTPPASTIPVVTAAEADPYMATTPRGPAWLAVDAAARDNLLIEAQRWLMGLCPSPDAEGCCGVFDDAWTAAASELALALNANPNALITAAGSANPQGNVQSQSLGGLSISFFEVSSTSQRFGPNAPVVLRVFPWIADLLGCWLPNYAWKNSGVIARYRS